MEENNVSYVVFEGQMARNERITKRLIVVIIILVAMLFASNAIWLYAWNQYDYEVEDNSLNYVQDGRGINIIGHENEVNNEPEVDGTESDLSPEEEER